MKSTGYVLAICLLAGITAASGAAQQADVEGSKDHPLVSRYPATVITEYAYAEFDEFVLPLGKLKDDAFEKHQKLEGKITRILYAAPPGRSILEIYRNFESAFAKGGFRTLFACANNDGCGNGQATLYAPKGGDDWSWNAGQRYLSAKLARPAGDVYVSLHIGQWTNTESGSAILLYVIEAKPMENDLVKVDAASLANDIAQSGHSSVYGIYFDTAKAEIKPESGAALAEIAKMLQANAPLKLLVVGHTDNVGALSSNMDLARKRADAVVAELSAHYGIAAGRLTAQGAGPLSPVASNKTEEGRARNRRVELVEQ